MLGKPPNEDEDNDKFEELFDKFMAMKGKANNITTAVYLHDYIILETAQSLPHEQRKAYAEKVKFNLFNKY